jgi:2-polyprenyl-3-methyl-5-hydroxy-6-metoxy-1,4-benzoquinol methylase
MSVKQLRVLVVIANYGTKNDIYLQRVLEEYRSLPYYVHVVVLTNTPKYIDPTTEVVVEQPIGHPWTFPFAHKVILANRLDDYDLFIYSEDDTLITNTNIQAFLNVSAVLDQDEIAGFLRVEQPPGGQRSVSTMNSHFHWDPTSVVRRGQYTFAYFTNEHSASYVLTREQLQRAMNSGGFLVPPHQDKYDFLVTAATDPYTQCGFRKLVCLSHIEDFFITHLPHKYVGHLGVSVEEFQLQLGALAEIAAGLRPATVLMSTETKLKQLRWSKHFYEPPRPAVLSLISSDITTLLSYGCGTGAAESELMKRGVQVTAVALDSVIGACAEARGIEVIHGNETAALRALSDRRFDVVLVLDLLHLLPDPVHLLAVFARLLSRNGSIIATVPNIAGLRTQWARLKGDPALKNLGNYDHTGVHLVSHKAAAQWFDTAGLATRTVFASAPEDARWWMRASARLFPRWLATEIVIQAKHMPSTTDDDHVQLPERSISA